MSLSLPFDGNPFTENPQTPTFSSSFMPHAEVLTTTTLDVRSQPEDISGVENVDEQYDTSPHKKWIKRVPKSDAIPFDEYSRKDQFIPIAEIVLDDEVIASGKKQGIKKRNTSIRFIQNRTTINAAEFADKSEWLYIFTINSRVVKIGGTRTGIKGRISSYLCGHHTEERGKSGDCSKTNGFIYNTFEFYLRLGCKIEMYGYKLPKTELIVDILGKPTKIIAQTYHAYESTFLEDYKKTHHSYPLLCDNCDPDYKDSPSREH